MKRKTIIIGLAVILIAAIVIGIFAMQQANNSPNTDLGSDSYATKDNNGQQQETGGTEDQTGEDLLWEQAVADFAGIYSRGSQKFAMIVEPISMSVCYLGLSEAGIEGEFPCEFGQDVLTIDMGESGVITLTLRQDGSLELKTDSPDPQDAVDIYYM